MRVCEFCGGEMVDAATQAKRHPECKKAANMLDAFQRELAAAVAAHGMTAERARILRSRAMSLGNVVQWRTDAMGRNLRKG